MIVVSDTSPITGLFIIGKLDLLQQIYGEIIIPRVVFDELLLLEKYGYKLEELKYLPWLKIKEPSDKELETRLNEDLHAGESAAITLAIELNADYLIIDEKKGRTVAEELGIEIIGLIGVFRIAKEMQLIDKVKPLLDALISEADFWISKKFYNYILKQLGKIISNPPRC